MPKPKGKPIKKIEGLEIYVELKKAKTKGKDRLWVSVRQDNPKKWRVASSLCYVNSFDVRFEREE